ncbi:F0F1 ATP synthase subunit epsilon [Clostridiisalibacter paucivorans]|uniref:F0F1 ATP synthase subunit epsilon n=1 Tax=Clostridiisalibacter paucivorans TaxID=408753 RepID=UPI00047A99F6|nr:F0F1 ATP synthase subunit epsilon [Clostridiisalibacter paucivorans]
MASKFKLEIVTPDRKFFEEDVEMLIVRGKEGDLGIMYNHIPLVTELSIGRLKIKQDNQTKEAAIATGFVKVTAEKTTIVTDAAEWPEEIDVDRAEKAKNRAEKRLQSNDSNIDTLRAEIALKKAINRINLGNKK